MTKNKVKKLDKDVKIEDGKNYVLTFPSRKARIEGDYILMGIPPGTSSSMSDDGQFVTVARGYQIKELDKLGIPWGFFRRKLNNNNHNTTALRK